MRMLVTGGTGLLGGRLIPKLVADGHQVFALTRSTSSHARLQAMGATPVDADLESGAPPVLPLIDAVVHAAAMFRFSGPRKPFFRTNTDGTAALLKAAGLRSEPIMSLPSATGCSRSARLTAAPPLDPPAVRVTSQALRVRPKTAL